MFPTFFKALQQFKDSLLCSICKETYKDPHILGECGHCFCKECAIRSIALHSKCHKCNLPATIRNLHKNSSYSNIIDAIAEFECKVETKDVNEEAENTENAQYTKSTKDQGSEEVGAIKSLEKVIKRKDFEVEITIDNSSANSKNTRKSWNEEKKTTENDNLEELTIKPDKNRSKKMKTTAKNSESKSAKSNISDRKCSNPVDSQPSDKSSARKSQFTKNSNEKSIQLLVQHGKLAVGDCLEYMGQKALITKSFRIKDSIEKEIFEGPTEWAVFINKTLFKNSKRPDGWKDVLHNGTSLDDLLSKITCSEKELDISTDSVVKNTMKSKFKNPKDNDKVNSTKKELTATVSNESFCTVYKFVFTGLNDVQKQILRDLPKHNKLPFSIVKELTASTTHVITDEQNGLCTRTMKYLEGLLSHCWVVSFEWFLQSLTNGKWLPEIDFLITGDSSVGHSNAPHLSKLQHASSHLFCDIVFDLSRYTASSLTIDDLLRLISCGKGTVRMNVTGKKGRKRDVDDNVYYIVSDDVQKSSSDKSISVSYFLQCISRYAFP